MNFQEINPQDAWELVKTDSAVLADIRKLEDFQQSHAQGAIHLGNENLQQYINQWEYEDPIIISCYHGISSRGVAEFLANQGFEHVYSLTGGFEGWQKAGLPVEK